MTFVGDGNVGMKAIALKFIAGQILLALKYCYIVARATVFTRCQFFAKNTIENQSAPVDLSLGIIFITGMISSSVTSLIKSVYCYIIYNTDALTILVFWNIKCWVQVPIKPVKIEMNSYSTCRGFVCFSPTSI